jgi:uroporphyrin-III C-methyltransferase/precorrin-2 dehydrogenase/sirohydrochlorin ferrochelatase
MLVNVVDRPELCDFTTPSILDRDPLLVAIGTGGASAGLAKHVRLRLERVLPATLGALALALEAARPALRARFADGAERRRAVDAALREGGLLDPLDPDAFQRVDDWASGVAAAPSGVVAAITVISADPEDLTLRQARLLGEADVLLIDGAVPPAILARARADAARVPWSASRARDAEGLEGGKSGSEPGKQGSGMLPASPQGAQQAETPTGLTIILRWQPVAQTEA